MLGDVGWQELVLVLAILALVFGASRVADLGGALGRGVREFRDEVKGDEKPAVPAKPADELPAETGSREGPAR